MQSDDKNVLAPLFLFLPLLHLQALSNLQFRRKVRSDLLSFQPKFEVCLQKVVLVWRWDERLTDGGFRFLDSSLGQR